MVETNIKQQTTPPEVSSQVLNFPQLMTSEILLQNQTNIILSIKYDGSLLSGSPGRHYNSN